MRRGIKTRITEYLEDKGMFDQVDMDLIDEYVTNIKFIKESKKILKDEGIMLRELRIAKGGVEYEIIKRHPAIDVYNKSLSNLKELCTKLGLSPLDRKRLKLIGIEEKGDELSEFDS